MTETIARRMLMDPGSTPAEREWARLWLRQRRLFPGDGRWWQAESWRESPAAVDKPGRLCGTIAELLEAKAG